MAALSTDEAVAIAVEQGKLRQLAFRHGGGAVGIQKAYRQIAMTAHPDHGGDPVRFRRLTQARDTLLAHEASVESAVRKIPGIEPLDPETRN